MCRCPFLIIFKCLILQSHHTFLIVIRIIKVRLSPFQNICFIFFHEGLSTIMKNAFYFILKALFILRVFKFLNFWSCRKNGLIRKISLISELMTSQPLLNKLLQYTDCQISHNVKAILFIFFNLSLKLTERQDISYNIPT